MQPTGVHHVSINVGDVAESVRFYTEVLGLELRADRPDDLGVDGVWLDAGDQQVHLILAGTPNGLGQHFALAVDDLDAAVAELRSGTIAVSDPSSVGAGRQSFLVDPSGNLVELHQPATR
ncbi:MAG: VOC family protein [Acidimicrobiales bacterium]